MSLEDEPIDILLDADGDIDLSSGDFVFSTGLQAVAQTAKIAVLMFRGEWHLDRELGVPWLPNDVVAVSDAVLGQRFNELRTMAALRAALSGIDNVVEILQLAATFNPSTRNLSVSWRLRTAFGDTPPDSAEVGV
jgi:hypothetical protein